MAEKQLELSRRDFLKTAGAIGLVAAAGGSIPLTMFTSGCPSGGAPAGDQILRANLASEPAQIDPNRASWAQELSVIRQCFQGVLGFNQDLTLRAETATQIPSTGNGGISSDGKTYTFKLKNNVTWSDGKKVTAKDYVYSIKRMLSPEIAADYASFYYGIAGAEAYNGGKGSADAVQVKAVDDYTLEIKLTEAQPTFLQIMALWPSYPVRQDIIESKGEQWTEPPNYIGNGPFILSEWVHQDHLTFKPNPNYWGTKPKLTEITMKDVADVNAELASYRNGELDFSRVPPGTESTFMNDPDLHRYAELTTFAWRFNLKVAPWDNINVRKGISCAVDRVAFVNQVRSGVGKPAWSWIPPGMPGYDANLGKDFDFNITNAKKYLADAGYTDLSKLPQIKFQYADSAGNKTIAQFLQGQMKDNLGINLVLEPMESKAFSTLVNNKQYSSSFYGWGADYPDPENWLPELFGTTAGNNKQNYSNAQFDAKVAAAKTELDNTKRLQLLDEAQKIVVADSPNCWMYYRERFFLMKPYVKGTKFTGQDGGLWGDWFFDEVYIQK